MLPLLAWSLPPKLTLATHNLNCRLIGRSGYLSRIALLSNDSANADLVMLIFRFC
jgi:hypothetical protein